MPSKTKTNKKKRNNNKGKGGVGPTASATVAHDDVAPKANKVPADVLSPPTYTTMMPNETAPALVAQNVRVSDEWWPGGQKMTRRADSNKAIYMDVIQAVLSTCFVSDVGAVTLTGDSFIELERGAHLAIIAPDGAALTMNEVKMSDNYFDHALTMCKVNEVTAQNNRLWSALLEKVKTEYCGNSKEERDAFARKRIDASLFLLQDIETKLASVNLDEPYLRSHSGQRTLVFLSTEAVAYEALFGYFFKISHYAGAFDSATMVLAINFLLLSDGLSFNKKIHTTLAVNRFLIYRGLCTSRSEGLSLMDAATNYRAASALLLHQTQTPEIQERLEHLERPPDFLENRTVEYLVTLSKQKRMMNATRPLFDERERKKIEKELGIGMYSKKRYRCAHCLTEPSDIVQLFRCSGCRDKWYCSQTCIERAWHCGGHKAECHEESDELILPIACIPPSKDDAIRHVCTSTGPHAIVFDKETDRFFSCLTNQDITFD